MYIDKDVQPIDPPDEFESILPDPQTRMTYIYDRDRLIIIELFQDLIVDECHKIVAALFERDTAFKPPKLLPNKKPNPYYLMSVHQDKELCKAQIMKAVESVWQDVQNSDLALDLYENGGYEDQELES